MPRSLQRLGWTKSPGHGLSDAGSSESIVDSVWAAPGSNLARGWRRARASGRRASMPPAASRGQPSARSARAGAGGGAAPRRAALQPGPGRGRWMPRLSSCCLPGGLRRPVSAGRPRGGEPGPGRWSGGFGPAAGSRDPAPSLSPGSGGPDSRLCPWRRRGAGQPGWGPIRSVGQGKRGARAGRLGAGGGIGWPSAWEG